MLDEDGNEVQMAETIDYGDEDLTPLIEGNNFLKSEENDSFTNAGYSAVSGEQGDEVLLDFEESDSEDMDEDIDMPEDFDPSSIIDDDFE